MTTPASEHELSLTRLIDAPREKLYRAWTEPALLQPPHEQSTHPPTPTAQRSAILPMTGRQRFQKRGDPLAVHSALYSAKDAGVAVPPGLSSFPNSKPQFGHTS